MSLLLMASMCSPRSVCLQAGASVAARHDTRTSCRAFADRPTCRPDPTMTSSAAFVESLRAPSEFLGRLTPFPAALAGDLAGDMAAACLTAGSPLRAAPLADLTVLGFFAGFSFSESEPRFVPLPERAPAPHMSHMTRVFEGSTAKRRAPSGKAARPQQTSKNRPLVIDKSALKSTTPIVYAPLSPSAASSQAVASAQLENSDPAHPAHQHHQWHAAFGAWQSSVCEVPLRPVASSSVTTAAGCRSSRTTARAVHR